jgi:DGQHR domain-containing protein
MKMTFAEFSEYKLPVPCVQGHFGKRLVTFTTQATPQFVVTLLGHDPRSSKRKQLDATNPALAAIYNTIQRDTVKGRRDSIADYISDRMPPAGAQAIGAFPAISIGCVNPEEFRAFPNMNWAGTLMIDAAATSQAQRIVLDGLGRLTGALDLIDAGHADAVNFKFPVTFYAPHPGDILSIQELGQLFADFNGRVFPVAKRLSLKLETADPYVRLARELAEESFLADHGGVAEGLASLGGKSTQLVVQTILVRTVRGACEGRKFQEANLAHAENPNLTEASWDDTRSSISLYFNAIAESMGDARWEDRESLHLSSAGWQAMGVIHHDLVYSLGMNGEDDLHAAAKAIADVDWSRYNTEWLALGIGVPEIDKATGKELLDAKGRRRITLSGAGRTNTQAIINFLRERVGIDTLLKEDEPSEV